MSGHGTPSAAQLCRTLGRTYSAGYAVSQQTHPDCCPQEAQLHPGPGTATLAYLCAVLTAKALPFLLNPPPQKNPTSTAAH